MLVGLIGDVHLHPYASFAKFDGVTGNSRLTELLTSLDWCWKDAIQRGCESIVFVGDIFNSHKLSPHYVYKIQKFFLKRTRAYPQVFAISGNHDYYDHKQKTMLSLLEEYIRIPNTNEVLVVVPNVWACNEIYDKDLTRFEWPSVNKTNVVLLTHTCVIGSKTPGYTIEGGVDVSVFKDFEKVYAGDIHHRQKIGNVIYTGCAHHTNFRDVGAPPGYMIYDTLTLKAKPIPNLAAPMFLTVKTEEELVEIREGLGDLPVYIDFQFDSKTNTQSMQKLMESFTKGFSMRPAVESAENVTLTGTSLPDLIKMYWKQHGKGIKHTKEVAKNLIELVGG